MVTICQIDYAKVYREFIKAIIEFSKIINLIVRAYMEIFNVLFVEFASTFAFIVEKNWYFDCTLFFRF